MKPGLLCLLLVSGCSFLTFPEDPPVVFEYVLSWTCQSPEGCERTEEVRRIDRMSLTDYVDVHFFSTQDESYGMDATLGFAASLPRGCAWLYFLTFFGHELERSPYCDIPSGFELELSIPNEDPATESQWLIEGLNVDLL